jgi:hypothetical protein
MDRNEKSCNSKCNICQNVTYKFLIYICNIILHQEGRSTNHVYFLRIEVCVWFLSPFNFPKTYMHLNIILMLEFQMKNQLHVFFYHLLESIT